MLKPVRFIAIAVLVFCSIASCTNDVSIESNSNVRCRSIQHAMGETCIPLKPQRVIILGATTLESALAIDIQPLASQTDVLPHLKGQLEGIEILDWPLNLERVVALNPDLIIGSANGQERENYDLLSQIAPTVLAGAQTSGDWKAVVRFMGKVFEKPETANRVLADYRARLDQFQQQMGDRLQEIEISVVRLYPDKINVYLKDSFIGTVLADAGLGRPPAQQLTADRALATVGNPIQMSISKERLADADGDVIFVVRYSDRPQIEKELETLLERLQTDPLWSRLEAVKQDRVYPVGSHWIVGGPLSARAVIDDLFEYLV